MRKLTSEKYPGYLRYDLFCSPAFRDLRPATRDIFTLLTYEIELETQKKTSKDRRVQRVKNRSEIKLPYDEIKDRLGYSHKTIWTAFKELFEHGFLDSVKLGGGCKNDPNIYKICEDWRTWQPGKIIRTLPEKNIKFGWQKLKNKLNSGKPVPLYSGNPTLAAINE